METDFPEGEKGVYIFDKAQIRIQEGLTPREQINTALHECLHAIIAVYGAKKRFKDDDQEEDLVNLLGNGLTEALSRNPDLTRWLAHYAAK